MKDPEPQADELAVAVVMPAFDAAHYLDTTIPAVLAAARGNEVVVVDAGSRDETAAVAEKYDVRLVRLPERAGPAEARNAGAAVVEADVVLFVDSDCVAHPDIVDRVREAFAADPQLASLTGSYDAEPPDPGFFSLYMNLRHHHTHQIAKRENATFWAGCGAVRLKAFREVGGFDVAQFPVPMVEDIELGLRMRELGNTRLDPDLNVTHLKRWTAGSVIATDIFKRAVPWSRIILERGDPPLDLNLRPAQRAAAALAPLALVALVALPVLTWAAPFWALAPAALLAVSWALNADLVHFFWRQRGPAFAIGAWLFHQVHLIYSGVTFVLMWLRSRSGVQAAS